MHPHPDLPPESGKGLTLWRVLLPFLAFQFFSPTSVAAPQFPALTGRVVDEAGVLSAPFETEIGTLLAAHEHATTNQLVVVTLASLQGYEVSDFANLLFRHWGIGQKDKNNGVLLVVALTERKLRIEVGYGLEGVLTDAVSRDIIERVIKPPLRQGQPEQAIRAGVVAILAALGGEYRPAPPPASGIGTDDLFDFLLPLFFLGAVMNGVLSKLVGKVFPRAARPLVAGTFAAIAAVVFWVFAQVLILAVVIGVIVFLLMLLSGSLPGRGGGSGGDWGSSGGGWSSGGGGGGFSGGGGSSGGGGASGSW